MKKIIYALLLFILPLSAIAQSKMRPIDFNDRLAAITDTIHTLGTAWGKKLMEIKSSQQFSELAPYRIQLEKYIADNIVRLQNMKDVSNSHDLRMGMILYLQFEQQLCISSFRPMENLTPSSTTEQVDAAIERIINDSKREAAELERFGKLQSEYAKSNGFRIEGGE